jgi:hypothetical protein
MASYAAPTTVEPAITAITAVQPPITAVQPPITAVQPPMIKLVWVPSDPGASYAMVDLAHSGDGLIDVSTRRIGKSGTSFAKRRTNCRTWWFRYMVSDADTYAELIAARDSASDLGPLVEGSISTNVADQACREAGLRRG